MLGDLDLAGGDQRQTVPALADPHQRLAGRIGVRRSKTPQPFELDRFQNRKHLLAPRGDQG